MDQELKDWMGRLEVKVDAIETKVDKLDAKVEERGKLRYKIMTALAALAIAAAGWLAGCTQVVVVKDQPQKTNIEHLYQAAIEVETTCAYPQMDLEKYEDSLPEEDKWLAEYIWWMWHFPKHQGSGFAVGNRQAITASHVVDCAIRHPYTWVVLTQGWVLDIHITTRKGAKFAMAVQTDKGRNVDAALLRTIGYWDPFDTWLEPAFSDPKIGQEVCILSVVPERAYKCDLVADHKHGRGDFKGAPGWMAEGYFTLTAPAEPGNSGSAVLDENDRVVGILVAGMSWTVYGAIGVEMFDELFPRDPWSIMNDEFLP